MLASFVRPQMYFFLQLTTFTTNSQAETQAVFANQGSNDTFQSMLAIPNWAMFVRNVSIHSTTDLTRKRQWFFSIDVICTVCLCKFHVCVFIIRLRFVTPPVRSTILLLSKAKNVSEHFNKCWIQQFRNLWMIFSPQDFDCVCLVRQYTIVNPHFPRCLQLGCELPYPAPGFIVNAWLDGLELSSVKRRKRFVLQMQLACPHTWPVPMSLGLKPLSSKSNWPDCIPLFCHTFSSAGSFREPDFWRSLSDWNGAHEA